MPILIFVFVVAIGIVIWATTSEKTRVKEDANSWNKWVSEMNQSIDKTYRKCFGESTQTPSAKLEQLHNASKSILNKAKRQYFTTTALITSIDTSSNLGRCGISETHFYTNLDSFKCDEISKYEDVKKNYTNVIQRNGDSSQIFCGLECYETLLTKGTEKTNTIKIALNEILCFKTEGSVQHLSNVQGGGVNLQGAVAGAIIGGGAAAIIGSQLGTEIKTEIVTKDDRKIMLVYQGSNGAVTLEIVSNAPDKTIAALRQLIPNKEESVVQIETQRNATAVSAISSADDLKKFKELLDLGVITQEEFDAKKKELLGI